MTAFESELREALTAAADAVGVPADPQAAVLRRAAGIKRRRGVASAASAAGVVAVAVLITGTVTGGRDRAVLPANPSPAVSPVSGGPRPTAPASLPPVPTATDAAAISCDPGSTTTVEQFAQRHPHPEDGLRVDETSGVPVVFDQGQRVPLPAGVAHLFDLARLPDGLLLGYSTTAQESAGQAERTLAVREGSGRLRTLAQGRIAGVALSPDRSSVAYLTLPGKGAAANGRPVSVAHVVDLATGRETARLGGIADERGGAYAAGWGSSGVIVTKDDGYLLWEPRSGARPQTIRAFSSLPIAVATDGTAMLLQVEGDCLVEGPPFAGTSADLTLVAQAFQEQFGVARETVSFSESVRTTVADVLAAFYPPGQQYVGGQKLPPDHQLVVVQLTGRFTHSDPGGGSPGSSECTTWLKIYDATTGTWLPFGQCDSKGGWDLSRVGLVDRARFTASTGTSGSGGVTFTNNSVGTPVRPQAPPARSTP